MIIHLVEKGRIDMEILEELEDVVSRGCFKLKLNNMDNRMEDVLEKITSISTIVEPREKLDVINEDSKDNKFLDCALEGGAEYIVSGDKHLLNLREFQGIKMINTKK